MTKKAAALTGLAMSALILAACGNTPDSTGTPFTFDPCKKDTIAVNYDDGTVPTILDCP